MARKRFVFLSTVESFVLKLVHQFKSELIFRRWGYHRLVVLLLLGVFLFTAAIPPVLSQMSNTNANNLSVEQVSQLVEQSRQHYENGEFEKAIESLQQAAKKFEKQKDWGNLASTLSNLGLSQLELGQSSAAFKSWEEAEKYFARIKNQPGITKSRVYQAQALQSLGLYYRACELLTTTVLPKSLQCDALDEKVKTENKDSLITNWDLLADAIKEEKDKSIQIIVWRSLGDVLRVIGDLDNSQKALENGLNVAQSEKQELAIHLSLGNTFRAKGNLERDRRSSPVYDYMPWRYVYVKQEETQEEKEKENYKKAENEYQLAINYSSSHLLQLQSQLNLLNLLIERNKIANAQNLLLQIYSKDKKKFILEIPNNLTSIYAKVNLAKSLAYLNQASAQENKIVEKQTTNWDEIIHFLIETQQETQALNDKRAKSYVLGNLGGLYEYLGKLNEAQKVTQEALYLAQPNEYPDIAYQWQWQMGRLLKQNNPEAAISSYKSAVKTLESVRSDLIAINSDVQFSFRDNVEPLYRDLVDLLLTNQKQDLKKTDNLRNAIKAIDNLQLAELINFTRCNFLNLVTVDNFKTPNTAIIYPVLLKDKLVTLYELPNQQEPFSPTEQPYPSLEEVKRTLASLRKKLATEGQTPEVIEDSKKVYKWIIKPVEKILKDKKVETLVFVLDGSLRNIPMSVLYDENDKEQKHYLIDKGYAVTIAPRLKLFNPNSSQASNHSLQRKLNVFTGGVGIAQSFNNNLSFSEIEKLNEELDGIAKFVNANNPLINENFTKQTIEKRLKSSNFSAIHWKTHGVFSSDPENTFIVAYKELIKTKDLNNLIQNGSKKGAAPLELIVLSACETAQGDNRAVLGLAGIAARTGARSVISTLWTAQDEPNTQFMIRFYKELSMPGITKSQAVLNAQKALKDEYGYDTPYYWANYTLIGNWL